MARPTISLRWLMALLMGGLVALSVAAAVVVEWLLARDITTRMLSDKAVTFIETVERGVIADLDLVGHSVDRIAELLIAGHLDLADIEATLGELRIAVAMQPAITGLALAFGEPGYVQALRLEDGSIETRAGRTLSPDMRERFDSIQASTARHEGSFWGEIIRSPDSGEPVLNVRRRVDRPGLEPVTIISGMTVGHLSRMVSRVSGADDVSIFMLDRDDRLLIDPRSGQAGGARAVADEAVASGLAHRRDAGDPVLAALEAGRPMARFREAREHGVEVLRIRTETLDSLLFIRAVQDVEQRGWRIGVHMPATILDPFIAPLRAGLWAGLALMVLAVLVALIASGFVARPVTRLTRVAGQIADLDLDDVPEVRSSSIRELADGADAFNRMLATLRVFATYVPRTLVRQLIRSASPEVIHSHTRELAVMFTDIAGFTALSETMEPGEVAALLNAHYTILAGCVEAEHGTVDKYLGDGMLAFWGAPDRVKDRSLRACRAALAIREAIIEDNRRRRDEGLEPVRVRIGIHSGMLTVGNIGSKDRLNYTVVGDTVNVAQRLQDLGHRLPPCDCLILVSDAVVADVGARFEIEDHGDLGVKGRAEPVRAFLLNGPRGTEPAAVRAAS